MKNNVCLSAIRNFYLNLIRLNKLKVSPLTHSYFCANYLSEAEIKIHSIMNTTDFKFLVECASKAPSGHNTQPWKFEHSDDRMIIHPDFTRELPVVDSDNHALYISLGCALENVIIAANQKGYESVVQYPMDPRSGIMIQLKKSDAVPADDLFNFISKRQVNRNKYSDNKISSHQLQKLHSSFSFDGVSITLLNGPEEFERIIPLIIEGNNLQFGNKQFVNELTSWCRYSKSEAEKTKDGLWAAAMGLPNMGKLIGNFVMRNIVSAKNEAKRLKNILKHTQGLAIFSADENDVASWIKTGRAFQRFGLTATKLGISHAHLNMPCEEAKVRYKLAKELMMENKHPLLLIRYGYAENMPYSYRRNVEDVMMEK